MAAVKIETPRHKPARGRARGLSLIDVMQATSDNRGSLAGSVNLPYRPDSFSVSDLRKAIARVKDSQVD